MIRNYKSLAPAVVFMTLFLSGHNAGVSFVQQAHAQASVTSTSTMTDTEWECYPYPAGCDPTGTATSVKDLLEQQLKTNLKDSAKDVEQKLSDLDDDMTKALLKRLNQTELDIIDWWKTMWYYGWKPSLQHKTDQLNAANADQSRMLQSATDAQNQTETKLEMQKDAIEADRTFHVAPNPCGDATIAGGQGRAAGLARGMRVAWQKDALAIGLNKKGTVGATGAIDAERQRYQDYKDQFCDPNGNGGRNDCTPPVSDAKYINADTQPTKFINNQLTIDVKSDPKMEKTVETINNNMMGVPAADPISKGALNSAAGQQTFLDRRAYLARYAAARTVPGLVAGWRMPGSQMGNWVKGLSEGAGITLDVSQNPSYKEIMHAEVVDRFNSGRYAVGMISDESEIEMEKLTLNAFYLMQLRDYYELLERTALTLAVQVSMMADQVPAGEAVSVAPVK